MTTRRNVFQASGLVVAGAVAGGVLAASAGAFAGSAAPAATAAGGAQPPASYAATGPHGQRPPRPPMQAGTVTAVGTASVGIKTASGTKTYAVDADSDIDKNGEAKLSDLKVGDAVHFAVRPGTSTIAVLHAGDEAKNGPGGSGRHHGPCPGMGPGMGLGAPMGPPPAASPAPSSSSNA